MAQVTKSTTQLQELIDTFSNYREVTDNIKALHKLGIGTKLDHLK
jgi:hypothetical protein